MKTSTPVATLSRGVSSRVAVALCLFLPQAFGAGLGNDNPNGPAGEYSGSITTAGYYDPYTGSVKRVVDDLVVPNSLGAYPLKWTRYLNTRGGTGTIFGQGGAWTHSYGYGFSRWDMPPPRFEPPEANGRVGYPDGRTIDLSRGTGAIYQPVKPGRDQVREVVQDMGNGQYDLLLADGGRVLFWQGHYLDGDVIRQGLIVQRILDPYGLMTTLERDEWGRLSKITEPGGRYLKLNYDRRQVVDDLGTRYHHLLTSVQAYDGRGNPGNLIETVTYYYALTTVTTSPLRKYYHLTRVHYDDNTDAYYTYQPSNGGVGTNMVWFHLVSTCDDVRYNGPMRQIKYEYATPGSHAGDGSWGRIKAERNMITNEVVSDVTYPAWGTDPSTDAYFKRTETRGDGQQRDFLYDHDQAIGSGDLIRYHDFQGHATNISFSTPSAGVTRKSVRDARHNTTHVDRAGMGLISKITYPGGAYVEYTYTDERYLHTRRNERGKVTTHTRDGLHRIIRTDYPADANTPASFEEFTYNNFGQVLTHRLKNEKYQHFQYDGRGLLLAKTNPTAISDWGSAINGAPKTTYTYYTSGPWIDRVRTETLPANESGLQASKTYEYDKNASGTPVPGRGLVTRITHADGKYQAFGYDDYGNKRWEENELRQRTSYTYDPYKRLLSATNPLYKTTAYRYELTNGNQNLFPTLHTTASVHLVTTPTGITTENRYDENFRKIKTTQAFGTGSAATTQFDYDEVGNLTWVTDPLNRRTRTQYDSRNRKFSSTEAHGTALATTTTWSYDPTGNVITIGRPDGTVQRKTYDALNRVLTDTVPQRGGDTPVGLTTRFAYNPSGTIHTVTDAKWQQTMFGYDASDRKTSMTYHGGTQFQSWTYDDAGNLRSRTTVGASPTPAGKTQTFKYDHRNRKIEMRWSNTAEWAQFGYDDAGRLTSAKNGTGAWNTNVISTVTRQYDAAGQLTLDQQAVTGLAAKSVNYITYDYDGKLTRMNVTGASYDYTFSYDAMGRFEKISPTGGAPAFQYYYDAASNETQRYNSLNGGVKQIYARDSLNRMSRLDVKKGDTPLSAEVYTYDRMSRLTGVNRWPENRQDLFGYYLNGEMFWAQYGVTGPQMPSEGGDPDQDMPNATDPWANWTGDPEAEGVPPPEDQGEPPPPPPPALELPAARNVTYSYDRAGNRLGMNDDGNPIWYTTNLLNQYTGITGAAVTNGNEHEISDYQGVHYTYRNDERLISVTGPATYDLAYDALGRCVKRILNGVRTYYIYDGEKAILEYNSAGTLVGRNLYGKGIDENLHRAYGGQTYYFQQDHNGNVTHLTSASGAIVEKYKYDAFGAPTIYNSGGVQIPSTAYNNRFLFTGREYAATYAGTYVPAFNFYEYRARAYNPTLGRFMSEDPKGFDSGDYNLFRYVHNDPLDLTDPMGLEENKVVQPQPNGQTQAGPIPQIRIHELGSNIPRAVVVDAKLIDYASRRGVNIGQGGLTTGQIASQAADGFKQVVSGMESYLRGIGRGLDAAAGLAGVKGVQAQTTQRQAISDIQAAISRAVQEAQKNPQAARQSAAQLLTLKIRYQGMHMGGRFAAASATNQIVVPVGRIPLPVGIGVTLLAGYGDASHMAVTVRQTARELHAEDLLDGILTGGDQ